MGKESVHHDHDQNKTKFKGNITDAVEKTVFDAFEYMIENENELNIKYSLAPAEEIVKEIKGKTKAEILDTTHPHFYEPNFELDLIILGVYLTNGSQQTVYKISKEKSGLFNSSINFFSPGRHNKKMYGGGRILNKQYDMFKVKGHGSSLFVEIKGKWYKYSDIKKLVSSLDPKGKEIVKNYLN